MQASSAVDEIVNFMLHLQMPSFRAYETRNLEKKPSRKRQQQAFNFLLQKKVRDRFVGRLVDGVLIRPCRVTFAGCQDLTALDVHDPAGHPRLIVGLLDRTQEHLVRAFNGAGRDVAFGNLIFQAGERGQRAIVRAQAHRKRGKGMAGISVVYLDVVGISEVVMRA